MVEYWGTGYDWRKVEATLNALPQFITEIDGLDIQFAHVRAGRTCPIAKGSPGRLACRNGRVLLRQVRRVDRHRRRAREGSVAVTVFPGEIYRAPRGWAEKAFGNLVYWNEVDKGGHFAAWEQPEVFATEMRAAFRSLR